MMGGAPAPQKPDNHEASMARADLYKSANYAFKLFKMIQDGQELEGWVQAKITKAADYIASVYHYMEYEMKFNEYGKKLEDSDIYTESVKKQFQQKLTEARVKLEKLKEKNIKDLDEGWDDMVAAGKKRAAEKGTGKFDSKKTSTGTVYTRKSSTFDDGGKDADTKKAEKKAKKVKEGSKPDFLDVDGDGNKKEPMKKAVADKKKKPFAKVEEGSTGDYSAKKAAAGKDIGKPGKNFEKIAKKAGEKYGSKERGEKVAGAVLAKLRKA